MRHGNARRVAVIGSGVSGLVAAYVLHRARDVTLYEADDRLGGHAHTHDLVLDGRTWGVDSGFIVYNEATYPLLTRLFGELRISTQGTEMSMSVSCRGCGLEYAGARGLTGLFADPRNTARPSYLALLAQVPLFHRRARALLNTPADGPGPTLGEFCAQARFTTHFVNHFVVPLVSAVWSCGPHLVGSYPARYLFGFLANHGMLSVQGSPQWRTVTGGSRTYVDAIGKQLPDVRTLTPVRAITLTTDGVDIRDDADRVDSFDAVVVATHPDQALRLLTAPSRAEREILGLFAYSENETVLHTDSTVLPRHRAARASWNYTLPACRPPAGSALVSYHMNPLQRLPSTTDVIVTLDPDPAAVDPAAVIARMRYRHPIYTPASVSAQRRLPEICGPRLTFAGAYHGWGFHEDGARSGVRAAADLGVVW